MHPFFLEGKEMGEAIIAPTNKYLFGFGLDA